MVNGRQNPLSNWSIAIPFDMPNCDCTVLVYGRESNKHNPEWLKWLYYRHNNYYHPEKIVNNT